MSSWTHPNLASGDWAADEARVSHTAPGCPSSLRRTTSPISLHFKPHHRPTVSSRSPPAGHHLVLAVSALQWQRRPRWQRAHGHLRPASTRAASPCAPPPSRQTAAVTALPPIRNLVRPPLAALSASLGACGRRLRNS